MPHVGERALNAPTPQVPILIRDAYDQSPDLICLPRSSRSLSLVAVVLRGNHPTIANQPVIESSSLTKKSNFHILSRFGIYEIHNPEAAH